MYSKLQKINIPRRTKIDVAKNKVAPKTVPATKRTNRCCFVRPKQQDFGQITEYSITDVFTDTPSNNLALKKDNDDNTPIIKTLKSNHQLTKKCFHEKKALKGVENFSQYDRNNIVSKYVETTDGSLWRSIDNIKEAENVIQAAQTGIQSQASYDLKPKNIRISDKPRLKVIALKFSKYRWQHIELRRLEEKIVCVEYDVYHINSQGNLTKPTQTMRAFFSLKPNPDKTFFENVPGLINNNENLKKLPKQEIEIIDGSVIENKCYLDDIRRVLKHKQYLNKNKTIDLEMLYEIAMRDSHLNDSSSTNMLSNSDLQGLKDMILQCNSSIQGISKKKVIPDKMSKVKSGSFSKSIVAELLGEDC